MPSPSGTAGPRLHPLLTYYSSSSTASRCLAHYNSAALVRNLHSDTIATTPFIPFHMAAAITVTVDAVRLRGISPVVRIPKSTFHSEFLRLHEQADHLGVSGSEAHIKRYIKSRIQNCYGHKCFKCKEQIILHYKDEPLCRHLAPDDRPAGAHPNSGFYSDNWGWFCEPCWAEYRRDKQNKRRRIAYKPKQRRRIAIEDDAPGLPSVELDVEASDSLDCEATLNFEGALSKLDARKSVGGTPPLIGIQV